MFKKELEMKIIRTRYKITFADDTSARYILQDLKLVPLDARLVESYDEGNTTVLIFEESLVVADKNSET